VALTALVSDTDHGSVNVRTDVVDHRGGELSREAAYGAGAEDDAGTAGASSKERIVPLFRSEGSC